MSKLPEMIKIDSNIIDKFNNKIRKIIHKIFLEFKKKEGNENEFYKKCLTPDSNFNYYLQWEILSQISIKELLIKSKLDEYIRKNISKNYYNSKGVFRPNKFLSIHKIDKELKTFRFENPRSLVP